MSSPAPKLRVAECRTCSQLFAVYETEGSVTCPSCQAEMAISSLEVAEIGVATAVEVQVEPPAPEPEPLVEPVAPQPVAEDRPPTVAEWLMRGGDPTVAASLQGPETAEPEPAPTLSESLGWGPDSFAPPPKEPEPEPEAASAPESSGPSEEFRFDFGATPLSEQAEPTPEGLDLVADDQVELPSDEAPQPAGLDWTAGEEPKRKRGWMGPLSAVAGLVTVAAPAAWLLFDWESQGLVAATANREERLAPPDPTPMAEPIAGDEFGAAPIDEPPADKPIVDPATQPATYEAEPDPATPPVDPFPASPPAAEATGDRYAAAAGDRYATTEPQPESEPDVFTPPEGGFEPLVEEPEPTAPKVVGLINTPYYGAAELEQATADAEVAARSFATGTLSDPEQVTEMGKSFAKLCYLAQVLTLLDPQASGPTAMTAELSAADVFKRLFREAGPRDEARQIAGPWMAWTGRPHGGVFFAGTPEEMIAVGDLVQYTFPVGDQVVPVVVEEKLDAERFLNSNAREIGVIGIVVENPRERLAGYEGDADRVVWVRKTVPLRAPIEL